jgi:hypothetical protein
MSSAEKAAQNYQDAQTRLATSVAQALRASNEWLGEEIDNTRRLVGYIAYLENWVARDRDPSQRVTIIRSARKRYGVDEGHRLGGVEIAIPEDAD